MDKPKKQKMLSVRVPPEDAEKLKTLVKKVKERNAYVTEADVIRELIGFLDTGLITTEMRIWLAQTSGDQGSLDGILEDGPAEKKGRIHKFIDKNELSDDVREPEEKERRRS